MMSPRVHQLTTLFEQVAPGVGRFGLVLDHMRECGLGCPAGDTCIPGPLRRRLPRLLQDFRRWLNESWRGSIWALW